MSKRLWRCFTNSIINSTSELNDNRKNLHVLRWDRKTEECQFNFTSNNDSVTKQKDWRMSIQLYIYSTIDHSIVYENNFIHDHIRQSSLIEIFDRSSQWSFVNRQSIMYESIILLTHVNRHSIMYENDYLNDTSTRQSALYETVIYWHSIHLRLVSLVLFSYTSMKELETRA